MSLENLPSCDLVMLFVRQFHHFDSPTGTSTRNDMNGDRQVTNGEKRDILLQATNNVLHLPILFDLAWYVVWAFYIAMAPFYLLCHILFSVLDTLFAIYSFARQQVKSLILFMKGKNGEAREERAILITGCDSGFGFDLAMALAAESLSCLEEEKKEGRREEPKGRRWRVYAGCLSAKGREQIIQRAPEATAHGILVPLSLDVTQASEVAAAVHRVRAECRGELFALVNNAGIGVAGLVDWMPMEHFRKIMEVNYFGMIAVSKACLPLLKKTGKQGMRRGKTSHLPSLRPQIDAPPRIVLVTSFAGLVPGQLSMGAYCASKHAAEAFGHALRSELECWGIRVPILNPTFHSTALVTAAAGSVEKAYQGMEREKQEEYGETFKEEIVRIASSVTTCASWDPSNVLRALRHATTADSPRRQYLIGMDGRFLLSPVMMLPERLVHFLTWLGSRRYRLCPAARGAGGRKGHKEE
ncbi:hypothetical protein NSK_005989 [Nannochloropsis salina CCMP1776]|uniref:Uncharacterized protein n=1 Tax=Nannochloropsis salina CCMP1776 TaxID=1027361 RepID=A0A4D9CYA1_9STRA|nr:hypothetical protein NSK_005989 [Nannochloropsis salina CCMP1776]|eukprot:TFJ82563.1 hypothetical protein NSK_005989 [Nannochloropsis salina CCMP1776]